MDEPIMLGVVGPGIIWQRPHKGILKRLSRYYSPVAFSSRTGESREKAATEILTSTCGGK